MTVDRSTVVLLEGLDCVGKTWAANQLIRGSRKIMIHAGQPAQSDPFKEYVDPLRAHPGYDIVCDRWHLGELVWPFVFNRPPILTLGDLPVLEQAMMRDQDVLLILVVANESFRKACRAGREEPVYDDDEVQALYREALRHTSLPYRVNTSHNVVKEVARWKSTLNTPH